MAVRWIQLYAQALWQRPRREFLLSTSSLVTIAYAANRKRLSNLNVDDCVIGVCMAPLEILLLLAPIDTIEVTIVPMLLLKIGAVSMIFVVVPGVIIVAVSIVVAFFVVVSIIRSRYDRTDQGGAQHESAQN
jgi:hypothetical protein